MSKSPIRRLAVPLLVTVLVLAVGLAATQSTRPDAAVTGIKLPVDLPAVGNLEAVQQWHLGRLERVIRTAGEPDVVLVIRTISLEVVEVRAPGPPLADLARQCGWVNPASSRPGRADYVERMIAFDADENGRLIAMLSLEPMDRNNNRLKRALG